MGYAWPGNVRELKSVLEYAFVVAEKGLITEDHLPPQIVQGENTIQQYEQLADRPDGDEEITLIDVLRLCNGNRSRAAEILGVNRITIRRRIKKYGIDIEKTLS